MRQQVLTPWAAERGRQMYLAEAPDATDPAWHPLWGRDIRREYTELTGRSLEEGLALLEWELEQKRTTHLLPPVAAERYR